jgi:iron(III) transport system substrate-binding protein
MAHGARARILAQAGIAMFVLFPALASADSLEQVIAAAKKEGAIVWNDSLLREDGEQILKAFQKDYPFVTKIEYQEVPSAQKTARIMQELQVGGPTADVIINSASAQQIYIDGGYAVKVDWKGMEVPVSPVNTPNDYLVLVTTASYGILYNTTKVSDAEAPRTWEALADPKWKKRSGTWAKANVFTNLLPTWGEEKTRSYVRKYAALQPRLFSSTYTLAQAVGSGEIDIALGIYHTAQPTIEKGAPVKWVYLDPTPIAPLYALILKYGKNPNTAKLLLKWLGSKSGALAYEEASQRGNHLVPETKTAQLLKGKALAHITAQQDEKTLGQYNKLETEFGRTLTGR